MLCYQNGYLLIFIRACHVHCIWEMVVVRGCTILRVVSRAAMDIIFRGMYHARRGFLLSRIVSRAMMNIIFWGTYRALRKLLLLMVVSCVTTDAWTDMSPMGPGLRDSGCVSLRKTCITIFDIASHLHCTFYYWRVLLILWLFLCEVCDCWILSCYWECVNW